MKILFFIFTAEIAQDSSLSLFDIKMLNNHAIFCQLSTENLLLVGFH